MDELFVIKIVVTAAIVAALARIAEVASPRLSGLLAGFPHGSAIVLAFIGLEQGEAFAAQAARYMLAGLAANVTLIAAYGITLRLGSRRETLRRPGPFAPLIPALTGLLAFFLAAASFDALFRSLPDRLVPRAAVTLAVIALAARLVRREDAGTIAAPKAFGPRLTLLRAAFAALIVVAITTAAHAIGPRWSGMLAGFPVVTFPFILIVHATYGAAPAASAISAYPLGLVALVAFTLATAATIETLGLWGALAAGFGAALLWSLVRPYFRLLRR